VHDFKLRITQQDSDSRYCRYDRIRNGRITNVLHDVISNFSYIFCYISQPSCAGTDSIIGEETERELLRLLLRDCNDDEGEQNSDDRGTDQSHCHDVTSCSIFRQFFGI